MLIPYDKYVIRDVLDYDDFCKCFDKNCNKNNNQIMGQQQQQQRRIY